MEWLGENLWAAWLSAAALLAVGEMFSLDLVMLMMAVGAVVGMTAALIGAPFLLQALVAAGGAVAMLALVRPSMARRLHRGQDLTHGHAKLVGTRGTVTASLSAIEPGRVKVAGEIWTAQPYDEHLTIAAGETVEVLEIRGATAYVHPVPTLES